MTPRILMLAGGLLLALASGAASAASDEAVTSPEALRSLLAGSSVYTADIVSQRGPRRDLWTFRADGTVHAEYAEVHRTSGLHVIDVYGSDEGRWDVRDGALCIAWRGDLARWSGCYLVTVAHPSPTNPVTHWAVDRATGTRLGFVVRH